MRLNTLIILFVLTLSCATALAGQESNVQELVPLPHPVKVVTANQEQLKISEEQMTRIKTDVVGYFPPRMLPMMIEAEESENRLVHKILVEGKTKQELAEEIDQLAALKRKLIDTHIDSLNTLKGILTDEQWSSLLVLLEEAKRN